MRSRPSLVAGLVLAVLASSLVFSGAQAGQAKGKYIVVLKGSVASPAAVATKHKIKHGAKIKYVYKNTIKGYAATLNKSELKALRKDPKVAYVERDGIVKIAGKTKRPKPPKGGEPTPAPDPEPDPQPGPTANWWGQDRIDERSLPLDGYYDVTQTGQGVYAYVLDTGVRISHDEFGNRASYGKDFIDGDSNANDCHGHGTHVAGTIAGTKYGVARAARIVAVRVLNCSGSGTWSGVIAGLDWVVANKGTHPTIVNISLSGPGNTAMDQAVARATGAGVTVVVAAGNSNANACNYSPARASSAIVVGSTTSSDARSSFSNYGTCVDIFAPGSGIKSAWRSKDNAYKTISGTSMASPHVAGVVALFLDKQPSAGPAAVNGELKSKASSNELSGIGSESPNLLVFAGAY